MNTQQPPNNVVPINAAPERTELPEPGFPMLTRMVSNPIFPSGEPVGKEEPITWILGKPHPFMPGMEVMRMFVDRGGVEIYSVSSDRHSGTRNMIPMTQVRIIEEAMPLDVFIEELAAAEGDDDEPDDPDEPVDPETPEPAPAPPVNGGQQTAPS